MIAARRRSFPTRLLLSVLFLVGLLVSFASDAMAQPKSKPRKFALLVAVDHYEEGSLLPKLPFPQRDIEGLAKVLIDSGYEPDHVVVLTSKVGANKFDLLPTADHIRTQFELILDKELTHADSVFIALAGHGVLLKVKKEGAKEPRPESFFCPMDANLGPRKDLSKFLSYQDMLDKLADTQAGVKLLFVDACRNELASESIGRAPGVELPAPPPPTPTVAAFYSCSERQVAWEDDTLDGGHGVFFHFVIEGMKGKADQLKGDDNGKVSLEELSMYVKENVRDFVARRRSVRQNPRLVGDIGEVTLLALRTNTQPVADIIKPKPMAPSQTKTPSVGKMSKPKPSDSGGSDGPITNTLGMKFMPIKAGEFWMGSPEGEMDAQADEHPRDRVSISRFMLGATEVTRGEFARFVSETGYKTEAEKAGGDSNWRNPGFEQSDDHPVTFVSWNDSKAFCAWLSKRDGVKYRLPTEAEWEYACRAGTETATAFGDSLSSVDANFNGNAPYNGAAKGPYLKKTSAVGEYRANDWGLFDMHGNVWEWCDDGYDAKQYEKSADRDPRGPESASSRVYRGGSWGGYGWLCRSAYRFRNDPTIRDFNLGFRVARVP